MATFPGATLTGWQRGGAVNIASLLIIGTILLVLLVVSIARPGSSLSRSTVLYHMNRTRIENLNLAFHVIITLISTGIFASSNFFMQIITAPSRQDINRAHSQIQHLDIGVPSIHNLKVVSPGKQAAWLALLLSSIPIHLLFSSSIFQTVFQGSD